MSPEVTAVFAPASDEDGGHQLGTRIWLSRVPIPRTAGSRFPGQGGRTHGRPDQGISRTAPPHGRPRWSRLCPPGLFPLPVTCSCLPPLSTTMSAGSCVTI